MLFTLLAGVGALLLITCILIRMTLLVVTVLLQSMTPILQQGDRVLALRYWPKRWLRVGQIVLISPGAALTRGVCSTDIYIKRIVAVGGETVTIPLDELRPELRGDVERDFQGRHTWNISLGHIFVRGDNRSDSIDSTSWGPLSVTQVRGIVLFKLLSKATTKEIQDLRAATSILLSTLPAGQPAPLFAAETVDGESVTLASYAGRNVVFLFIRPSAFHKNALTECMKSASHAAQAGVEFIVVSDGDAMRTRAFLLEAGINLPVLLAPREKNTFLADYKAMNTPSYCLIDANGIVQSAGYPSLKWGNWKTLVEAWERYIPPSNDVPVERRQENTSVVHPA